MPTVDNVDSYKDPLVVACDEMLEDLGITLWAHHTIDQPEERWAASVWLAGQIRRVFPEHLDPKQLARDVVRKPYPMTSRD